MSARRGGRIARVLAGALIVVALGAGGFALGRAGRTSQALIDADQRAAREHAYAQAYQHAFRTGQLLGEARGLPEGEARGAARVAELGQATGANAAAARELLRSRRRSGAGG